MSVGDVLTVVGIVAALTTSSLAIYLNWRTERKVEKRDLVKERNDLLDIALKSILTLQSIKFQLRVLLLHFGSRNTADEMEEKVAGYEKSVQDAIGQVESYREELKQGPLTAELIDDLSIKIRETHLYHEDFAPKVGEAVEQMQEFARTLRELKD